MGGVLPVVLGDIVNIAGQHRLGIIIGGSVNSLGQVDNDRAVFIDQYIKLRQVTVHQARTEHQHHVVHHHRMIFKSLLLCKGHVVETRCHITLIVCHQLHNQHAVKTAVGFWHSHPGPRQTVEGINLGILPNFLLLLATELRTLLDRSGAPTVAYLATLLIFHRLFEAALGRFFVNFGTADMLTTAHNKDVGLFATH